MKKLAFLPLILLAAAFHGCGSETSPSSGKAPTAQLLQASLDAAEEYFASREIAKAEMIVTELLKQAAQDWRVQELSGRIHLAKAYEARTAGAADAARLFKNALGSYEEAVRLNPTAAGLHHSTGMVARETGDLTAAIRHIQEAGRLEPTNPQYPLYESSLLMAMKRWDESEEAARRVLAIKPDEPFAHASLSAIALEQGKFDEAIAHINRARELDPENLAIRVQEARMYRMMDQPARTLELLLPFTMAASLQEAVVHEVTAAYMTLKEFEKVSRLWERFFEQSHGRSWRAAVGVGMPELEAGRRDQAERWCVEAEVAPNQAEVKELRRKLDDA